MNRRTSFGGDVFLADMRVEPSDDGQYLLIYCGSSIVCILGSMGGDVEVFEFADVGRLTAMEAIGVEVYSYQRTALAKCLGRSRTNEARS